MAADQTEQIKQPPVYETTWLEGITHIEWKPQPGDIIILMYTLANGHRYAIPLQGEVLAYTRKAVSPVVIAGANEMPVNGRSKDTP